MPGPIGADQDGATVPFDTRRPGDLDSSGRSGGPGKHGKAGPAAGGWLRRRRAARAERPRGSLLRELPVLVLFALVIAMVIKTFMVQAFVIPSGSMENTLALYDKILVNKLVYDFRAIEPGDIVVFNGEGSWNASASSPSSSNPLARIFDDTIRRAVDSVGGLFGTPVGQTDYVKRVIGVPGDHVVCCNAQGLITVNGVPLHEQSYLYPGDKPSSAPDGIRGHFSVTVPPGYLWVLGDHRSVSDDSRGHRFDPGNGMIPENKVIGRAFVIVWPPSKWRILPIPATFDQPGVAGTAAARPQQTAVAASLGGGQLTATVRPAAPYLPAAAGLVGAVPLTWLERRTRRWFRDRIPGRSRGRR
ncbi:MAG: signal peptidase I [Streptosporangiaceae bacterium]